MITYIFDIIECKFKLTFCFFDFLSLVCVNFATKLLKKCDGQICLLKKMSINCDPEITPRNTLISNKILNIQNLLFESMRRDIKNPNITFKLFLSLI